MTVVGGLKGCRGGVAGAVGDLAMESPVVEPVEEGEGGHLDVGEAVPGAVAVDELPLVEPAPTSSIPAQSSDDARVARELLTREDYWEAVRAPATVHRRGP